MHPEKLLIDVVGSLWTYTHPDRPDRMLVEWDTYSPYYDLDDFEEVDDIELVYNEKSISIISSPLRVQDDNKYIYKFNVRCDRHGFTSKDLIDKVLIYEKKYHIKIKEENERLYFRGLKHLSDGLYVSIWEDDILI
jgi:hypothetical protein